MLSTIMSPSASE